MLSIIHRLAVLTLGVVTLMYARVGGSPAEGKLRVRAEKLAREIIIVDTHVDVPYRLHDEMEDVSIRTLKGDFDCPRAIAGGLNAPFMSIYVPASYEEKGGAKAFADSMIDLVEKIARDSPTKFALTKSVAEVRAQFLKGIISLPMGMENGSPIEGKLENVRYFYDRGIRYITLTHSKSNHICDSSYDEERKWNGLSPFGRTVVAEMNRLGIMVDVSHVSDSTFWQVIRVSKAPVIASHSSCRYFTPGFERNMDDDMIKALAANGGVIQINFGSTFLRKDLRERMSEETQALRTFVQENKLDENNPKAKEFRQQFHKEHPVGYANVTDVVDHIEHVVKLVGVDFVGFGSDFDGVGDSLPVGLKDVSCYPNLILELLKRGYSEEKIGKICSGNLLRVWSQVDSIASELRKSGW